MTIRWPLKLLCLALIAGSLVVLTNVAPRAFGWLVFPGGILAAYILPTSFHDARWILLTNTLNFFTYLFILILIEATVTRLRKTQR